MAAAAGAAPEPESADGSRCEDINTAPVLATTCTRPQHQPPPHLLHLGGYRDSGQVLENVVTAYEWLIIIVKTCVGL